MRPCVVAIVCMFLHECNACIESTIKMQCLFQYFRMHSWLLFHVNTSKNIIHITIWYAFMYVLVCVCVYGIGIVLAGARSFFVFLCRSLPHSISFSLPILVHTHVTFNVRPLTLIRNNFFFSRFIHFFLLFLFLSLSLACAFCLYSFCCYCCCCYFICVYVFTHPFTLCIVE